jgi:hypothetical protein
MSDFGGQGVVIGVTSADSERIVCKNLLEGCRLLQGLCDSLWAWVLDFLCSSVNYCIVKMVNAWLQLVLML